MRRISGLTHEQILAYEAVIEAATLAGLRRVMDAIADRIAAIQVAAGDNYRIALIDNSVIVAADDESELGPPPEPTPDLPPGQPYVSPDDLATIPPAWQGVVAENLLPIAAEIWLESSGMIYAGMVDATSAALPSVGSLAAERYLAQARNTFEEIGDHLWGVAQSELLAGFEAGESIPQLAERLRESANITARTGTLVARTQVIEASNGGSIATARASGLAMQKEWIATPDPRTRPTHIAADGQRRDLAEPFTVGGYSADFPADPSLPPAERYNCRCTIGYLIPEREARQAPRNVPPPPVEPLGAPEPATPLGPTGYPARPGIPAAPGYPARGGVPARPGTPGRPGIPGRPGYPARPGRPTPSRSFPARPGPQGPDVPESLEPADMTVIRPELRRTASLGELQRAWRDEWKRITGDDISVMLPRDASLLTMQQYAEGLLQAAARFPSVRIRSVGFWNEERGPYAKMTMGNAPGQGEIRFNAWWASTDHRQDLLRSLRGDVKGWTGPTRSGWSVRGATTPQATSYHEFAHALDIDTLGGRVHPAALRAVERRAALEGVPADELVARDISAYAGSDINELVGEAFTDVMINGERASAISREIYEMLTFEYRASGYGLRLSARTDVDIDGDLEDFSEFPKEAAPGLASRTVPQLRALAAERGIPVPAGARKADLVRLLEEPGPDADIDDFIRRNEAALTQAQRGDLTELTDVERRQYWADRAAGMDHRRAFMSPAERAALDQQEILTRAGNVSKVLAEMEELVANQASIEGIEHSLRTAAQLRGLPDADRDKLLAALARNPAAFNRALAALARREGLTRTGRAGDRVTFRRGEFDDLGADLPSGTEVTILRPGFTFGETRVAKPVVIRADDVAPAAPVRQTAQAAVTSTRGAIARQSAIDKARAVGDLGADVLAQLENGMSGAALRTRITQTAARLRSPDAVRDALLAVADDPVALRQAVAAALRKAKVDVVGGDAGQVLTFDRALMQAVDGGTIADGAQVVIVRPGLSLLRGRERIQLSKAQVEVATPEEIRQAERRATRAAARERNRELTQADGTARLLAEIDELIAKQADISVIRERLDDALLAPEALFAGADPAVMAALRAAADTGDVAKVRAAVTRLSSKAKIKAISRSGAKTKFDPATMMEAPGAPEIKAGAQVTVVTRGSTVTLEDGTVVQLRKAVVTPVAKKAGPPQATTVPSRQADRIDVIMDDAADVDWHGLSGQAWQDKRDEFHARIVKALDAEYGPQGLRVRIHPDDVVPTGKMLKFDGDIVDARGRRVGEFQRSIHRDKNGDLYANHAVLEIQRSMQGSGFAEEFNQNLFDWYRRSGVKRVELTANIDVGGYAWATKGFDFVDEITAQEFLDVARAKVATALRRKVPPKGLTRGDLEQLRDYLDQIDDGAIPARAFDISQFGRQRGQGGKAATWAGKWLMLGKGISWDGVKYL